MTDPTSRPDDELVSAVLDGEASADERALVEADPGAQARLGELAAVRDQVAAPVTVPAGARERALAAALAAFDAAPPGVAPGHGPGPVAAPPTSVPHDELGARRARRSGPGGRYLAVAAAVIIVLFGAGIVLRALNPESGRTVASSSDAAAPTTSSRAEQGGAVGEANQSTDAAEPTTTIQPSTPTAPTATTSPLPPIDDQPFPADLVAVDLGSARSIRDLRTELLGVVDARAADAEDPRASTTPTGPPSLARADWARCASALDAVDDELGELLAVGTATLDGQPVVAYAFAIDQAVHPAANGSIRIYAVDPASCATVVVQTTR